MGRQNKSEKLVIKSSGLNVRRIFLQSSYLICEMLLFDTDNFILFFLIDQKTK